MSKFVIECPKCGRFAEGRTGFFAKKKIECSCGHIINVRTEKLTSRQCPHCGNMVVFDQTKGSDAKCPVCHEPINTFAEQTQAVEFSCAQCGVRLMTSKGATTYTCPVCDCENNIAERLMSEKIKHDGLASIIKYEGDNQTLIWKHPIEDFNCFSQLIVHESQEAIFFRDGQALDLFGPGRYTLETQKLPLMEKLYKLPTDTDGTFHSEVYFINKTVQMAIKWGTPDKVRMLDPLTSTPIELGASGEMNIMVQDSRKLLLKLVGTMKGIAWDDGPGFTKSLQNSFRPMIVSAVKTNLSAVIKQNEIDILEVDEKLDLISASLRSKVSEGFEEYGLTIPQFYVTSIVLPENDPNFKLIRELHTVILQSKTYQAHAAVETIKAQTEAQYRSAQERSKAEIEAAHREAEMQRQETETEVARRKAERKVIDAQAEAQSLRMKGLTEAEIMQAKGYTGKDILQAGVQKAYAKGIGNMGPIVSGSGGGGGSSVIGDIMGLSMGMAVAQKTMPQMNAMFQGINPNGIQSEQPSENTDKAHRKTADSWNCPTCGTTGITTKFCPDCGTKKPDERPTDTWDCNDCGMKSITSKFCPNCGAPRPEKKIGWKCQKCQTDGITSNFCPNCGEKKPDPGWECTNCGLKGIKTGFCPNCGQKKGE